MRSGGLKEGQVVIQVLNEEEPRKLKCTKEAFVGLLIIFLDEQALDICRTYQIFKGRSKISLTFERIIKIISPYILSWYPETGEKELTFETKDQTLEYSGVYELMDKIHIQFSNAGEILKGMELGLQITNSTYNRDANHIFEIDGEYIPLYKKYPKSDSKKKNIKRYTVISGKRRRSIIVPRQMKDARGREIYKPLHMIEIEKSLKIIEEAPPKILRGKKKKVLVVSKVVKEVKEEKEKEEK